MKKMYYLILGKDATFIRSCIFASLLCVSSLAIGQGNGTLACNDLVQVSLDADCEAQILPDMILEGTYNPYSQFSVTISGITGDVVVQPGSHSVTVTSNITGNNCWGNILVEDKLPPTIDTCPCAENNQDPDCQFKCSDLARIQNGDIQAPKPTVDENCGSYQTLKSEQVIDNGCNGKVLITTYKYVDQYGNMSPSCKVYYYLAPIDFSDISPPDLNVNVPCSNGVSMQEIYDYYVPLIGAEAALSKAYPTINGAIIDNQGPCNIIATKTDSKTLVCGNDCPNSFKMVRTWSVVDWCSNNTRDYVQIISTKDTEKPTIKGTDLTKSVNPWNCAADFVFPLPSILHDNCDANVTYNIGGPIGVSIVYDPIKKEYKAVDVPKGIHDFYYRAIDCCGNIGIDTVKVTVLDQSAPVAISKEFVVLSLTKENGNDGIAKLFPQSIDNGSHDGCTDVHLEVRREGGDCGHIGNNTYNNDGHPNDDVDDPDDGNFVKFCCADLTDVTADGVPFGRVKVWLRVWDDGDMDGKYGSAGDNYNETWSWVRVEDKLPPTIDCPADITIECYEDYDNLDVTGRATASYTCSEGDVEYEDRNINLNTCGFGTLDRRWFLGSNPSNYCTQRITIETNTYFDPKTIVWPADETTDCKSIHGYEVTWTDANCSLLGVSVSTDTFQFVENVCLKILNRYTVVDWCIYEPNDPYSGGIWSHTQVVKVQDDTAPTITCQDTMVVASDPGDTDNDGVTCEHKGLMLTNSAADEGDCSTKWLRWQVYVDLWGDGVSEYEFTSFVPSTDKTFNDSNNNGVPDIYLAPTNSNQEVKITIPVDIPGSMSNHKVTWKVTDGCGNHRSCTTNVMVVDKKKPTPYCISLSSAVMENGTVELWARDFDKGSFDNCTAQEDLLFTFNNASPIVGKFSSEHFFKGDGQVATEAEYLTGDAQKWVPAFNSSSMIFDCDDLPVAEVNMTVWDEKGEFDFCVVTLSLVDNQDACDGNRVGISGQINDIQGNGMSDVTVRLVNDQLANFSKETISNNDGKYEFTNQPSNIDYTISVYKDGDYMNGVSTLDLVLIQRHILGLATLNDAHKVIGADVNNDGSIRTSDLVELRKLILGVTDKFSNNTSWRFVDGNQTFADANHPWPIHEAMDIIDAIGDKNNINFVGQKIGDVNGSAKSNLRSTAADNRSANSLKLIATEMNVANGESINVDLAPSKAASIYGLQFTITADQLDIIDIQSSVFDITSDSYYKDMNGNVNVIVYSSNLVEVSKGQSLVTLKAKAKGQGELSSMIDVTSTNVNAEAYFDGFEVGSVQLSFMTYKQDNEAGFKLLQNEPNPFSDNTRIGFILPEDSMVKINIYDVDGKSVLSHEAAYQIGENMFEIQKDQLPTNGVYYCKLESNTNSSIIKMIHLK